MADQAEQAFLRVYINTLATQPITYKDDYQQPPQNSLKKVPVLQISLPAPPRRKHADASSSAPITLTFKSLKPPAAYTVQVSPTDTVAAVKALLAAQPAGPPVPAQRLLHKGKALADAKLVKEYPIADGDTVNLVLKPLPAATPTSTPIAATMPADKPSSLPTGGGRHQRIPSVVLSPSPSGEAPGSPAAADITLTLDNATSTLPAQELSAYHAAVAAPEFWARLLAFLRSEFTSDSDAQIAFEDFLRASKGTLTANEIAKIRDHVGVVGMAGT
ncbi:ubiquitin-domain-containing protein [Mycena rosella]|uniref:Ubiquitin-domain-containing protein n=1 Tax=Mycena rosella TaxID=1033263 RepID=A0AAD7GQD1_MYCRO|nr:ubiquitin-domain-containing protein [Mycena rosella]